MENNVEKFVHDEFGELEVWQEDGEIWFPATECAKKLGYAQPEHAVKRHCPHCTKRTVGVQTGVKQDGTPAFQTIQKQYISEGDLFRLIIRSKLEAARMFEEWVCDVILPSIRKHGAYILPELLEELRENTEKNADLLKTLADEQRQRIRAESDLRSLASAKTALEEKIEQDKPKLTYYETILNNPAAVPVTLIAKDYGYTAISFNQLLHDYGIQYRVGGTWELYQEYAGNGYTHGNIHYTKGNHVKMHTCWTQKGRLFLYEFLKKCDILPTIEVNK